MLRVAVLIIILLGVAAAQATTIQVPSDQPTIQAGIDAALAADTVLVADGTYTGEGNRDLDFGGKNIILVSENGPDVTIIDCNGSFSTNYFAFNFHSGETNAAIVDGFTIMRGYRDQSGGGISCRNSSPTIRNNIISNCESWGRGGAISCKNSSAVISDNLITENTSFTGGGIACDSSNLTIINNTISDNDAHQFDGGGIYLNQSRLVARVAKAEWEMSTRRAVTNQRLEISP